MVGAGIIIVMLTFAAIIRHVEARPALFLSGMLMCLIGGKPSAGTDAFIQGFTNPGLVPTVCMVLGFSAVMKHTGCSDQMVRCASAMLNKCACLLIPGTVLITFVINIALPSAAGCAAAVGALLVPVLVRSGVRPATAGSAVLLGTWGSVMSPGLVFNTQTAEIAGVDVMTVIGAFVPQVIVGVLVAACLLAGIASLRKENRGHAPKGLAEAREDAKVNRLYAVVPAIPVLLLMAGGAPIRLIPEISVPGAMLAGVAVCLVVTRPDLTEATKTFFRGVGDGMCDVVGLIAAAACFTAGMEAIGLTGALIELMRDSRHVAQFAAAFGPFLIAALSGSGDAATLAFNGAVTPHAADFGRGVVELGSMAQIGASLGRSMSPVSGACVILAKTAGVTPMALAARNAVPTLAATVVIMLTLL